ncbi:MAG: RNA polymerase sigma factor [Acidimicrobiales bacterium]
MSQLSPTDPQRLAALFEAHVDTVFGFLLARSGSRQVAEEVSADTFAEAARMFSVGRGDQIERGWLLDVARKRLVDYWRRCERHRLRLERFLQFQPGAAAVESSDGQGPGVVEALETLPDRQRAVLMLRYLDGYSVSEVAEALEISYQATESLLARSRKSLLAAYERSAQ